MTFEQTIDRNFIRFIVQKQIWCAVTNEVLDVDTCVVIRDADGDPIGVFSQEGWQKIVNTASAAGIAEDAILKPGHYADPSTIR